MPALATLLILTLIVGCKDHAPTEPPAASASAAPASAPAPEVSARRPTRRYYLGRTAARCEIYYLDASGASTPLATPCPMDLMVGERIRIAGKTCMREGNDPERVEPTVCPDPLTNFEIKDRGESRY